VGLVSACSLRAPRGRGSIRGTRSHGLDGCRRRCPVVHGGFHGTQSDRGIHFMPGGMDIPEVEILAVASGQRSYDRSYQWHLAYRPVLGDTILCSGRMDRPFNLCTGGQRAPVLVTTRNVAMGICISDSFRFSDPSGYFVAGSEDSRVSIIMSIVIQILYSEGCVHTPSTIDLVKSVAGELSADVDLEVIEVADVAQAEALNYPGSPTVRIAGTDVDPVAGNAKFSGFG
jgi:hypothetical protein